MTDLVNQVLNRLPSYVFLSEKTTFADLQMGGAQFLLEVVQILRKNGHSDENISSRVFGFAENEIYLRYVKEKYSHLPINFELYNDNIKMKFDVICGNPPYQSNEDRNSKGNKVKSYKQPLWPLFVLKGLELLKPNGFLSLITPMSWLAGTYDIRKGRVHLLNKFTSDFNLKYCNLDSEKIAKTHFNGIGSTFSYFIVQNSPYEFDTVVDNKYGTHNMDMSKVKSIPLDPHPIKLSINSKTINSDLEKFAFKSVTFKPDGKDTNSMSETHQIKGYCNGGQMGNTIFSYWEKPDKYYGKRKILIGKMDRTYLPFVDNEGLNIGQNQLWYCEMRNEDIYETAIKIFNHPLYKFLINSNKHGAGPETHLIYSLPKIDLSKIWTDEEIFKNFDLNEEEIDYIKRNVK
jgi:site-specific DNA-methyltransferase (adenine-specific)